MDTAIELNREIAIHFERLSNALAEPSLKKQAGQNSRRAYSSVDHLRRINVS